MKIISQSENNFSKVNEIYNEQTFIYSNIDVICIKENYPFENKSKSNASQQKKLNNILLDFEVKYTIDESIYENLNFIGKIIIPKIGINYPIIDRTSDDLLNISICKFNGVNVHENGNLSLAGHNNKNNTMFGELDKLSIGDKIYLENIQGLTKAYVVNEILTVNPDEVWVAEVTQLDYPELTLITCNADGKKRRIYKALLKT